MIFPLVPIAAKLISMYPCSDRLELEMLEGLVPGERKIRSINLPEGLRVVEMLRCWAISNLHGIFYR